jgi:Fur family ferric uptake transcriptional regulator
MPAEDPRLDTLLERVREQGGRRTTARRVILQILLDADGEHLSVDELATRVQEHHPEVHLSTVYRSLEALEQAGVLVHVHLGHGPSTYHLADQPHHHAVCEECGAVVHLPADLFDTISTRVRDEHDFELAPHHFALAGRCVKCLSAD